MGDDNRAAVWRSGKDVQIQVFTVEDANTTRSVVDDPKWYRIDDSLLSIEDKDGDFWYFPLANVVEIRVIRMEEGL